MSLVYMAHRLYHHYPQFSSGPSKHGHMVHSLRTNIQPTWASACPLVLKESLRAISCALEKKTTIVEGEGPELSPFGSSFLEEFIYSPYWGMSPKSLFNRQRHTKG